MIRWQNFTLVLLTGILIGSMRKVWPWKITLESQIIRGKEYVIREENVWPLFNTELVSSLLLVFFGFTLIVLLEKISKFHSKNYIVSSK